MSSTRTLAGYLSALKYEDLPPPVAEKGRLLILDAIGNCIGGYPLALANPFLEMSKELGGGSPQATLIGDGSKVAPPMAAYANGALSTMLDYCDSFASQGGTNLAWMGPMAVPGALATGEGRGISGRELIVSVVAGYECAARIVASMDQTPEQEAKVAGSSLSVFASAGAAARALGQDRDRFLSTLGMAGMYTPVPAGYKWIGDEGLTPRKDIKQGWAWMTMVGVFAAVSAEKGLQMLQENNILDGDHGLWRMLGMDIFRDEEVTAGLGERFHVLRFATKSFPGCAVTHTAMAGVTDLVRDQRLAPEDIEAVHVVTNRAGGIGFEDQAPTRLVDREFSMPYQVAAAVLAGTKGPGWYSEELAGGDGFRDMERRVSLGFDEESEQVYRDTHARISKVILSTRDGRSFRTRVDDTDRYTDWDGVLAKFMDTTTQVISRDHAESIAGAVKGLESMASISELMGLLKVPRS